MTQLFTETHEGQHTLKWPIDDDATQLSDEDLASRLVYAWGMSGGMSITLEQERKWGKEAARLKDEALRRGS